MRTCDGFRRTSISVAMTNIVKNHKSLTKRLLFPGTPIFGSVGACEERKRLYAAFEHAPMKVPRTMANLDWPEPFLVWQRSPSNQGGEGAALLTPCQPCAYFIWVVDSAKPSRPVRQPANVRRRVALPSVAPPNSLRGKRWHGASEADFRLGLRLAARTAIATARESPVSGIAAKPLGIPAYAAAP
jgi:hypothetical protein